MKDEQSNCSIMKIEGHLTEGGAQSNLMFPM